MWVPPTPARNEFLDLSVAPNGLCGFVGSAYTMILYDDWEGVCGFCTLNETKNLGFVKNLYKAHFYVLVCYFIWADARKESSLDCLGSKKF